MQKVVNYRKDIEKIKKDLEDRVRIYRVKNDLEAELNQALATTKAENRSALILSSLE
jgi:hypothetical protein